MRAFAAILAVALGLLTATAPEQANLGAPDDLRADAVHVLRQVRGVAPFLPVPRATVFQVIALSIVTDVQ